MGIASDILTMPVKAWVLVLVLEEVLYDLSDDYNHCQDFFPGHRLDITHLRTTLWFQVSAAKVRRFFYLTKNNLMTDGNK